MFLSGTAAAAGATCRAVPERSQGLWDVDDESSGLGDDEPTEPRWCLADATSRPHAGVRDISNTKQVAPWSLDGADQPGVPERVNAGAGRASQDRCRLPQFEDIERRRAENEVEA